MVKRARDGEARAHTNVLAPAARVVGRDGERARIAEFFQDGTRLVTLVAPGGMGKTTIALQFIVEHAATYSAHGGGGAWLVDLTEAGSASDVVSKVASVLGATLVESERVGDAIAELGRVLAARKHLLLVLDNFERLAAIAKHTIAEWMRVAPSARFLVTSRIPLELPGEQLLPLGGLDAKDAARLFGLRARAVRPDLALDDGEARATIASIVRKVDGIPLSIELAAGRAIALSLDQIERRLARSLDLLVDRGGAGRHASMRRAIADSYELLGAKERAMFAACAVFRGGFTLDAAEAILGTGATSTLEALVTRSLVHVTTERLHRFALYETIAELATEQFAARKDAEKIRTRHVAYFAGHAAALAARAPFSPHAFASLEAEIDNVIAAHAHACRTKDVEGALALTAALAPVLDRRGDSRLRIELCDRALAPKARPTSARASTILARSRARLELRDVEGAEADCQRAHDLAKRLKNKAIEADVLLARGELFEIAGAMSAAQECYRAAIALGAGAADDVALHRRARAHQLYGHTLRREGRLDEARVDFDRAASIYRSIGDDYGLADASYEGAVIALFRRRYDEARTRFDEGLALARKIGARAIEGSIDTAVGSLLQEEGDVDGALARHAAAVLAFREIGKRSREGNTLYYLAGAHLERGDAIEADKLLVLAREAVRGELRYEALIDGARAIALARNGDFSEAARLFRAAERAAKKVENEGSLRATIAIHALHVGALESARQRTEGLRRAEALAAAHASDDPRFALRLFATKARTPSAALIVNANSFRVAPAPAVDLAQRAPLRRILHALAQKRIDAPGDALALEEILSAAWPGERVQPAAAANRVRVAIAALRSLGLRDVLVSAARGYLLSPAVTVTLAI